MEINFGEEIRILDGAMGTMLQKEGMGTEESTTRFGITHPHILKKIHKKYIEAGSDVIYAATFGINRLKSGELGMPVEEAMKRAVGAATEAAEEAFEKNGRRVFTALDIGPLGELLEPMGTLTFEEAYDVFREMVLLGEKYGTDMAVIETMTDLYEVRAAVLAVKENSDMPVMVSMTFEENGRTFTGVSLEAMAITAEALGVDAVGINCSLGPSEILPMAEKLKSLTSLPVFAKPNAGLPDPSTGQYDITAEMFAGEMAKYLEAGVDIIGGCCGTTEEYIKLMAEKMEVLDGGRREKKSGYTSREKSRGLRVCSGSAVVKADHVAVIGERINPTGKKRLKQALLDEDFDYIMAQAIEQADAGAEIIDVNVGVPGVDDVKLLPAVVKKLQSVTDLPLQIDSSNPQAIEAALRVYNGKPIVNSVNGEDSVMEDILPIVKKYGAAVIGLTLDDKGIPDSAEGRVAIAERILKKAREAGLPEEDVIIDCLALTASAQQKEVNETLKAIRLVKEKLGLKTALGVSNISFGLPARNLINRTFFTMAMECGLDLPIINPNDEDMMASLAAFNVLKNIDKNAVKYIDRYGADETEPEKGKAPSGIYGGNPHEDIFYFIEKGMKAETAEAVEKLLESHEELETVNNFLIPALDNVGKGFERGTIFLPQMLQAASAAQGGFDVIKASLSAGEREAVSLGRVALATVKGDIHDIGKNIVKVIMENYGYQVIDLGRDVPAEKIAAVAKEKNLRLIGLSALMTTTLKSMEETIKAVKEAAPQCRIMAGGAVLTEEYAKSIGADFYCGDAMKSVEAAQEVFNEQI